MSTKNINQSFTYLIKSNSFNADWIKDFIYEIEKSDILLTDLVLSEKSKVKISQLIEEYKNIERLKSFNWLKPIHKIILEWESWCWKTTTALALANALDKWMIIVNLTEIISSKLWETSKNLNKVIEYAESNKYYKGFVL